MNKLPLVTVYIPTCNRVDLLKRAINSVLRQTYTNIELIVVDDASIDGTVEYLKELSSTECRIKYMVNEQNSGACLSRNRAISAASGEFITGLDDDDYFLEDHIMSYVDKWSSLNKSVAALYCNITRKIGADKYKKAFRKKGLCHAKDLLCANWPGNQVFTRTDYLRMVGGFDVKLQAWQDYDCWYRLLNATGKEAVGTGLYTYVLDVSHAYDRISSSDKNKFIKSYDRFISKNELTRLESKLVKLLLINYGIGTIGLKDIFLKLNYSKSIHNIRHVFVLLYLSLRK